MTARHTATARPAVECAVGKAHIEELGLEWCRIVVTMKCISYMANATSGHLCRHLLQEHDLPLTKVGEHKGRVLSEITVAADDTVLKADGVIEQVTTLEEHDGGLVKGAGVSDKQEKSIGSQQQSSSELQVDCSIVVKKLRALLHSAEEQLHAHKKAVFFLKQLAVKTLPKDRLIWKLGTLPPGLIIFWNKTFPLSRSWHVLGLGYNPHVSSRDIECAAVIHYNGNMKPCLEVGLPKFQSYWSKYLDYVQSFLWECNINP